MIKKKQNVAPQKQIERKVVVDNTKKAEVLAKLQANIKELNHAVSALKEVDDIFQVDSVEGLKGITLEWLHEYIAKVQKSISEDERFPSVTKQILLDKWRLINDEASPYCQTVQLIAQWDGLPLQVDWHGRYYYDADAMQAYAEKEAQTTLSDEDARYHTLLSGLCASLKKIAEWEKAHGYRPMTSEGAVVSLPNGSYRQLTLLDILTDDECAFHLSSSSFLDWVNRGVIGRDEAGVIETSKLHRSYNK